MSAIAAEFLAEIRENPSDVTPRLIYADWLDERAEPLAELIRVQCELAAKPRSDERCDELTERQRVLLHKHRRTWVSPLISSGIRNVRFRRGFVEEAQFEVQRFLTHGDEMFRLVPVLTSLKFSRVRQGMTERFVNCFSQHESLGWLRSLNLSESYLTWKELERLGESQLNNLEQLDLSWSRWLDDDAIEVLVKRIVSPQLRVLDLRGVHFTGRGARAIVECERLRNLNLLVVGPTLSRSFSRNFFQILRQRFGNRLMVV